VRDDAPVFAVLSARPVASLNGGMAGDVDGQPPSYAFPGTDRFPLFDEAGNEFSIFVARPRAAAGEASLPVLHLLDANASFGTMVEAVRLRGERPEVSGVTPAWVVGIGFPTDQPLDMVRRTYHYTPPSDRLVMPERPGGAPWPRMGGANGFLDFLDTILRPELARRYGIGDARRAIFGHSFGGLFVLHALFTRPSLFDAYIAASPSIWWNDRFILGEEKAFLEEASFGKAVPKLLLTSGSEENRGPFADDNRDRVRDLAARLAASRKLTASYHEFAGEDHGSVLPAAIGRAVTFACERV
jgi:predicted alpha/beta superfamily hydrolase